MADALDFLDSLGIDREAVDNPNSAYQEYLVELGNAIVKIFKSDTKALGLYDGAAILQSIISIPDGELGVAIQADDYYKFIDQGVDGTEVSHGAPYKFKNENPSPEHVQKIQDWIPKRNIFLPAEIGSYKSFAYVIARSVKRKGIKPKKITDKVFTPEILAQITNDLEEITGLIVKFTFEKNFK